MPPRIAAALLSLLFLAHPGFAGVIVGRVVDSNGQGVPNVNIDADFSSGGGNPTVLNGGTDANGFFTTTITPNGVFDLVFTPPAPPVTTHLIREMFDVSVVGTVDLGLVVLPAGHALSGRVIGPAGFGVPDVNLDVLDASGSNLTITHDFTDATGHFSLAVPAGVLTVRLDPSGVVGQTLAPREFQQPVSGSLNLGDVPMQQGFLVSGFVKRANLTGVLDVDLDVFDTATQLKLFTPSDTTTGTGSFLLVLPAGQFDVKFSPPFSQLLVSAELAALQVAGNLNLGNVILQSGVVLSGTVQAFNGLKYPDVDVDVRIASTGAAVPLSNDNTSALGTYQVVVPTGTLNVRFTPPYALPLASQFVNGVVVAANKVQNGTLPSCPFYSNSGPGTPGTGGLVPQLTAVGGAPRLGNPDYALNVSGGRGGASAVILWTPAVQAVGPFPSGAVWSASGGYRVITLSGTAGVAGAGSGSVAVPIGGQALFGGVALRARAFVIDRASASGRAFTPYLDATLLP